MPTHVVRVLLLLFVAAVLGFTAQKLFAPESYYRFGAYRADSVSEIAAQEPVFQTPVYCRSCHAERHAQWSANNHKSVTCESCHGAAQGHPQQVKLSIPADTIRLCTVCHEAMPGRPAAQPQIHPGEHMAGQPCVTCHDPHAPKILAASAAVAGDAAAGARHAAACAGCHGARGISPNDTWPNLAGQNAVYLARILAAYQSGAQQDVVMTPIARALTDAEVKDLAAYYAGLDCSVAPIETRIGDARAGRTLAANCAACHGETGITENPAWPSIAGQQPVYLVNILKAFRAGLRKDPMMAGIARSLSDVDIANLAAFYAGQTCQPAAR